MFEVYRSYARNGGGFEWRWRFKASNGEVVAQGEGYKRRVDCLSAITLLIECDDDTQINISTASQGEPPVVVAEESD